MHQFKPGHAGFKFLLQPQLLHGPEQLAPHAGAQGTAHPAQSHGMAVRMAHQLHQQFNGRAAAFCAAPPAGEHQLPPPSRGGSPCGLRGRPGRSARPAPAVRQMSSTSTTRCTGSAAERSGSFTSISMAFIRMARPGSCIISSPFLPYSGYSFSPMAMAISSCRKRWMGSCSCCAAIGIHTPFRLKMGGKRRGARFLFRAPPPVFLMIQDSTGRTGLSKGQISIFSGLFKGQFRFFSGLFAVSCRRGGVLKANALQRLLVLAAQPAFVHIQHPADVRPGLVQQIAGPHQLAELFILQQFNGHQHLRLRRIGRLQFFRQPAPQRFQLLHALLQLMQIRPAHHLHPLPKIRGNPGDHLLQLPKLLAHQPRLVQLNLVTAQKFHCLCSASHSAVSSRCK